MLILRKRSFGHINVAHLGWCSKPSKFQACLPCRPFGTTSQSDQINRLKSLAIAMTGVGSVVGGAYVMQNEKDKRETKRLIHSVFRIMNLVKTAALMATDYGINLWLYKAYYADRHKDHAEIDRMYAHLRKLQADQETVNLKIIDIKHQLIGLKKKTISPSEVADLERLSSMYKNQLAEIMADLKRVSKDIAAVNGDGPVQHHRAQYLHPIHIRNAQRLRDMCAENGGLYIKLGQHLAMLDHVMPMEYPGILTTLLANTPTSSIDSVNRVFEEDLGQRPEDIFDSFNPIPIASASLAQVHVATKNGHKFAVKVQHEGLIEGSDIDRFVITRIVDVLGEIFAGFRYQWLTKEMNLNLPKELDFQCEKDNLLQATKKLDNFIKSGDVAVPSPVTELSSKRILTMSFEEGVYVSRIKDCANYQMSASDVSTLISRVFCEQIFRNGFVHCDPHEANLLIRPHPKNPHKPQLVLLDHGLYRQLDEQLRRDYARLWQAIILADEKNIEKYCKRLKAGDLYTLLAAVLTLKSWDNVISNDGIDHLHQAGKNNAELVVLQQYALRYFDYIVELLDTVPSDLLLLLKTNDCLRHLDKTLRTPVNSTTVVGDVASKVILEEELQDILSHSSGWVNTIQRTANVTVDYLNVQSRIAALSMVGRMYGWIITGISSWRTYLGWDTETEK